MNSLEITKCNNEGCLTAKANGELATVVFGLVVFGLGVYCIHQHYQYKTQVALASLNQGNYPSFPLALQS